MYKDLDQDVKDLRGCQASYHLIEIILAGSQLGIRAGCDVASGSSRGSCPGAAQILHNCGRESPVWDQGAG